MYVNVYIPDDISPENSGYLKGFISDYSAMKNGTVTLIISNNVGPNICEASIGSFNNEKLQYDKKNWISLKTLPHLVVTELFINSLSVDLLDITLIIYNSYEIEESVILKNISETYSQPIRSFANFSQLYVTKNIYKQTHLFQVIINFITVYYKLIFMMKSFIIKSDKLLNKSLGINSCFLSQLLLRIKQIKCIKKCSHKSKNYLLTFRLVGVVATDIFLGILCVYLLFQVTSSTEIHGRVKYSAKMLASNVQNLLTKLRGAPAGLKLNQPLTEAYASFFSYIVHLWTIYLDKANSVMAVVSCFFMFVGVLGLSTLAALVADIFNLVSLHIYCVYVYAARIHMMQVSIVGSQWRAFRGKKWNPLKQRCDCLDEFSQRPLRKILTVFVFTVVIFLLPTTTVYYAVFVLMRLCFLCMNGLITHFIWCLNYNPLFLLVQYMIQSPKIKGEIHFEMMSNKTLNSETLPFLKMNLQPSSLMEIITVSNEKGTIPDFPSPDLNKIYNSLIYAHSLF